DRGRAGGGGRVGKCTNLLADDESISRSHLALRAGRRQGQRGHLRYLFVRPAYRVRSTTGRIRSVQSTPYPLLRGATELVLREGWFEWRAFDAGQLFRNENEASAC